MARSGGRPATEVDFSDSGQAGAWLQRQPPELRMVLAVRAALRVKPLIDVGHHSQVPASGIVLPVLRACFVAWANVKYPSRLGRSRSAAAAAAAARAADAVSSADSPLLLYAARYIIPYAAADAARAAAEAARSNFGVAVYAATRAAVAIRAAVQADAIAIEQGRTVAEIVAAPLWPGEIPERIAEDWGRLRTWMLKDEANHWDPWVQWYERVRDGRPSFGEAFDLAVASLTDAQWNEEPRPAAVNRRIAALLAEHTPPEPIPPQGPGPHFTLGPDLRIALAPPAELDADGNNLARIRQLLPLVRQTAADLAGQLNPNLHPELARIVTQYREALGIEGEAVAWGLVFGHGVRLQNAASAAGRDIPDRMREPLEDAAQEALDSVLTLHGPLILATKEGRELIEDAERLRLTRDQQAALRDDAQTLARDLKNSPELIEPPAATLAGEAADSIGEGPHPERGTVFGRATVGNILTLLVPAGVLGAVHLGASHLVGGGEAGLAAGEAAAAFVGFGAAEIERFRIAAHSLNDDLARTVELAKDQSDLVRAQAVARLRLLTPFRDFITRNEEPLRRIIESTPQLRWARRYIDFIVRTNSHGH
jgi:hypothetical protein